MKQLLILASAMILTSCGASKISPLVMPSEITNVSFFEPYSYISYIEKGNRGTFSDSLSNITQNALDSILVNNKSKFRLTDKIYYTDTITKNKVAREVEQLAKTIVKNKKLDGIAVPATIDSMMKSKNQRFALETSAYGFGRKKGNQGNQIAKGAAIGILTAGMFIPVPIKSNLTIYALIFDSEKNQIAFYKVTTATKEPTDKESIDKLLTSLFDGYLYQLKQ